MAGNVDKKDEFTKGVRSAASQPKQVSKTIHVTNPNLAKPISMQYFGVDANTGFPVGTGGPGSSPLPVSREPTPCPPADREYYVDIRGFDPAIGWDNAARNAVADTRQKSIERVEDAIKMHLTEVSKTTTVVHPESGEDTPQ